MHPFYIETGLSSGTRIAALSLSYVALAAWLKYVVARVPLGVARTAFSVPAFAANILYPCTFNNDEELMERLSTVFIFSWLCNFKVLAFCWGRAPLQESMTVPQLAAVMLLPVFPKPPERAKEGPEGRLHDSAGSGLSLASRWIAKIALLGAIVYLLVTRGDAMPGMLRHYVYAFGLYAFVGFLMDGPAAVAVEALGVPLIPTFDQPWLSSSLADFWGRRWNITTSSVLRTVVYDTIVDGSIVNPRWRRLLPPPPPSAKGQQQPGTPEVTTPPPPRRGHTAGPAASLSDQQQQEQLEGGEVKGPSTPPQKEEQSGRQQDGATKQQQQQQLRKPSLLRRQVALQAAFFVSGAVHEYIAWFVSDNNRWGWKWLVYFWMQASMMSAEGYVARGMRRKGMQLPRVLKVVMTLLLIEAMSYELFFGFVEKDTMLSRRVIGAVSSNYLELLRAARSALGPVLSPLSDLVAPLLPTAVNKL